MFIGARLGQGVGAALMLPAALSTLTTTFTPARTVPRRWLWGAVAGLSSAIESSPVAPSSRARWALVMFVNPIACALIVPRSWPSFPPTGRRQDQALRPGRLNAHDRRDAAARVCAREGTYPGWSATATWLELAGAAALLTAFVIAERLVADPILPPSTFRIPGLVAANLTGLVGFAGMLTMFFFLTLYMQTVLGYSPLEAGAAYLPLTFGIGVSAGVGAKLVTKSAAAS